MLVSLFAGLLGIAYAEEVPVVEEKDIFTVVDDAFGKYFAGPLASVLFWDVMSSITLGLGDGVGLVVDGHYVADWTDGYTLPSFTVPESLLTIRLAEPVIMKNDFFEWIIAQNRIEPSVNNAQQSDLEVN